MAVPQEIVGKVFEISQPSAENHGYGHIVLELSSSDDKFQNFRKMDLPKGETVDIEIGDIVLVSFWLNGRYGKPGTAHAARVFNSDRVHEVTMKDPAEGRPANDQQQNDNFGNRRANDQAKATDIPF